MTHIDYKILYQNAEDQHQEWKKMAHGLSDRLSQINTLLEGAAGKSYADWETTFAQCRSLANAEQANGSKND
jgi:hypothetical protein